MRFLALALILFAFNAQAQERTIDLRLEEAGVHLETAGKHKQIGVMVLVIGGAITGLSASIDQSKNNDNNIGTPIIGAVTLIAGVGFNLSSGSHLKRSGAAMRRRE